MNRFFIIASVYLCITILLCIIRAIKGPDAANRLIAINVISTKTIVLISLISFVLKENYFLDVVLIYALISFISSVIISSYLSKEGDMKK